MGVLLILFFCFVAAAAWMSTGKAGATQKTTAHFVALNPSDNYLRPNKIIVTARTEAGVTETKTVAMDVLLSHGCRVGDEVDGTLTGVTLSFAPLTCRPPKAGTATRTPR